MKWLLDTHAFLWLVFDSEKLSDPVRGVVQDPAHEIHVSAVSFWEISLKFALGKLVLEQCTPEDLVKAAKKIPLEVLSLSPEEAASSYQLPRRSHKDPFDRMIVWQAIRHRMPLITRDASLDDYRSLGLKILW